MSFAAAFARTIGHEGDFSDDPNDSGGATRFGITEAVARANGYDGPMRELPFAKAREIAKRQYWDALNLDQVPPRIASEIFDTGYNMGTRRAAQFLQRSLNSLNRGGRDYADITVDGDIGPATLSALAAYLDERGICEGETVLLRALNCLQGAAYIELGFRRPKDEDFMFGWLRTRVEIAA